MNGYWSQKASPWVSFSVLVGGIVSAVILFFLVRVEKNVEFFSFTTKVDIDTYLQEVE
ncbi:MAG: hypothetical protein WDZ64_01155 [Parcubacteria group bacterium]